MVTTHQFLSILQRARTDEIIVTTMATVRPWGVLSTSELDFASADSAMGHAADLALGIALAQPTRTVVCLNGDGSMLMTLGTLTTIVGSSATNLVLIVMNNGVYEITGHQPIPAAGTLDFAAMARGAGFKQVYECETEQQCVEFVPKMLRAVGPVFANVRVVGGSQGPISRTPHESAQYLQRSLADSARALRSAIIQS